MAFQPAQFSEDACVICRKPVSIDGDTKLVQVKEGRKRLAESSVTRHDVSLNEYLLSEPVVVKVHEHCRRTYLYISAEQHRISCDTSGIPEKKKFLRSNLGERTRSGIDWRNACFLCAKSATYDKKHPNKKDAVHSAKTDRITETM